MRERRRATRSRADVAVIVMFALGIGVPFLGTFRGGAPGAIRQTERRRAALFPALETRSIGPLAIPKKRSLKRFPREFEAWFNDHVGFRRQFIRGYNLARVCGLTSESFARPAVGHSPRSPVIIGRDGWLFFSGDRLVEDYRCTSPFTDEELARWRRVISQRRAWLDSLGIEYLLVVPPNKHTIYGEYLPRSLNRVSQRSRLDQFLEAARLAGVEVVDLRDALRRAKSQCPTYHKTDTHWNDFGAYVGYREIIRHVARRHRAARPRPLDDYRIRRVQSSGDYLATMLDSPVPFREKLIKLTPRFQRTWKLETTDRRAAGVRTKLSRNPRGELTSAVVIHDSFMTALAPFLNENWRRVRYVWTQEFPAELIEYERPMLVIHEFVERRLMDEVPRNPSEIYPHGWKHTDSAASSELHHPCASIRVGTTRRR